MSLFVFSRSDDVAALSRLLFASLFSLSECRLRRELEPLRSDGRPRLRTDDFFAEPGTVGEDRLVSFVGDVALGARRWMPAGGGGPVDSVGETADGGIPGGTCIDCDDDRRKKGIDDGVKRFVDGFRRIDDDGLSGALCGASGTFVLARDAVSALLDTSRSGVLDVVTVGCPGTDGESACTEPTDDKEAKDVAEAIASEWTGDQPSPDERGFAVGESGFSLDIDLRSCCPKDIVRGLLTGDLGFGWASRMEDVEGVEESFLPSAPEKLHFFDGVLCRFVGVVDLGTWRELCFEGVAGNAGASSVDGNVTSLNVSRRLRSGAGAATST